MTGAKSLAPGEILLQEGVFYRAEGLQLQKAGELHRAAAAFRKAITIKPDYAEAYNDLGVVLESLGDLDEAEEAYKTALKFKPDLGSAHSNLALLYEESDRLKQAAAHWGARVRLGPLKDPWVAAAREKLAKYRLPGLETGEDKAQEKGKEIRLLRSARTGAAQTQGQQIRELEAAKGRVTKEAANARREEAARETEARVKQARPPVTPVVKPAAEVKVKPGPSTAPPDAQALAREVVKEKSKVRGKALDDLVRRAAVAMRGGLYQDAVESYKQILILEPGNRSAKQGLERAQKALAKQL